MCCEARQALHKAQWEMRVRVGLTKALQMAACLQGSHGRAGIVMQRPARSAPLRTTDPA